MATSDTLAPLPALGLHALRAIRGRWAVADADKAPRDPRAPGTHVRTNDAAGWTDHATAEAARREAGLPHVGILLGLLPGQPDGRPVTLAGLDLDTCIAPGRDAIEDPEALEPWAREVLAALGDTHAEVSPSGRGIKAFFLLDGTPEDAAKTLGLSGRTGRKLALGEGRHPPAVELFLSRRFFVVTGRALDVLPLATVTPETLARVLDVARTWAERLTGRKPAALGGADADREQVAEAAAVTAETVADVSAEMLAALDRAEPRPASQFRIGGADTSRSAYAAKAATEAAAMPGTAGAALLVAFAERCGTCEPAAEWLREKLTQGDARAIVRVVGLGLTNRPPPAAEAFRDRFVTDAPAEDRAEESEAAEDGPDSAAPPLSDDGLAHAFAAARAHRWRFVPGTEQWQRFCPASRRWDAAEASAVARDLMAFLADVAARVEPEGRASLCSARKRAAVLASAKLVLAAQAAEQSPWEIGVPGGKVDLRSGTFTTLPPREMPLRCISVRPAADCPTPAWDGFLEAFTRGDPERVAFLRRWVGAALSGVLDRRDRGHVLVLYGPKRTGKTTFSDTIKRLFGAYQKAAPRSAIIQGHHSGHPADIAALEGVRLATLSEVDDRTRFRHDVLKGASSGVAARGMGENFREVVVGARFLIDTNHLPALDDASGALAGRIVIFPADPDLARIAEAAQALHDALDAELPGIAAWAVGGAVEWAASGLNIPASLIAAREALTDEPDLVADFMAERCRKGPGLRVRMAEVLSAFNHYAEAQGERPHSPVSFGHAVRRTGLTVWRSDGVRYVLGLALRPPHWVEPEDGQRGPGEVVPFPPRTEPHPAPETRP